MRIPKNKRRAPLISERFEIQSDPFLHETPEVKSRIIGRLNTVMFNEKLNALKRQYPSASKRELHSRLLDLLRRISQRESARPGVSG
jgi:hypothetical protein